MTQLRDVLKACDYPALSRVQPHKVVIQNLPCPMIDHQGQSKSKGPFAIIHANRAYEGSPQSSKDEYTHGTWLCQDCQREGSRYGSWTRVLLGIGIYRMASGYLFTRTLYWVVFAGRVILLMRLGRKSLVFL